MVSTEVTVSVVGCVVVIIVVIKDLGSSVISREVVSMWNSVAVVVTIGISELSALW